MKIMLVSRVWMTQRSGGMIHVVHDRANALGALGHEVHVVTTSNTKTAGQYQNPYYACEDGIEVHYTNTPGHEWSIEFAKACREWAVALKPDVIHIDSFDRDNIWWEGLGIRVAITMHGFMFGTQLTRWNEYRAFGRISHNTSAWGTDPNFFPAVDITKEIRGLQTADVVFGVSKWEYRLLRDQYGLERAHLLYNPIAPYFFEPRAAQGSPRAGFLCAAVSQAGTRGFHIAQEAARKSGAHLKVLQKIPRKDMVAQYDQIKAVILPTAFCQGFDLTVCEARARGVPAIMTATGSYLEEATPWDDLVTLGNVDDLADAMSHPIAMDVQSTQALQEIAVQNHHPNEHAQSWLAMVSP